MTARVLSDSLALVLTASCGLVASAQENRPQAVREHDSLAGPEPTDIGV